ncbi:hypothetical protein [Xanthovirga aplysinae]|uniref:hypothetical protein n=1 Tax=Xanthovirga aplysinae TaxID=2529853 RepID=UPI0012BD0887|nr:hypothetical protein [Xanthovirga aplysinae]MTI29437.1 hypothetical protein [Xanthovirga aplysinae]
MKNQYQGKTEEILTELGRKIDLLISETKNASGEIKEGLEERIMEIRRNKADLEKELREFGRQHEGKWRLIENRLGRAADEIKEAIKIVFSKENPSGPKKDES